MTNLDTAELLSLAREMNSAREWAEATPDPTDGGGDGISARSDNLSGKEGPAAERLPPQLRDLFGLSPESRSYGPDPECGMARMANDTDSEEISSTEEEQCLATEDLTTDADPLDSDPYLDLWRGLLTSSLDPEAPGTPGTPSTLASSGETADWAEAVAAVGASSRRLRALTNAAVAATEASPPTEAQARLVSHAERIVQSNAAALARARSGRKLAAVGSAAELEPLAEQLGTDYKIALVLHRAEEEAPLRLLI